MLVLSLSVLVARLQIIYGSFSASADLWNLGQAGVLTAFSTNAAAAAASDVDAPFGSYSPTTSYSAWDPCANSIGTSTAVAAPYVVRFFSSSGDFDSNSILAMETDEVSFYVLRTEAPAARAAVGAEEMVVPGADQGGAVAAALPIHSLVLSALPDSVEFLTVTVLAQDTSASLTGVNYDASVCVCVPVGVGGWVGYFMCARPSLPSAAGQSVGVCGSPGGLARALGCLSLARVQ